MFLGGRRNGASFLFVGGGSPGGDDCDGYAVDLEPADSLVPAIKRGATAYLLLLVSVAQVCS